MRILYYSVYTLYKALMKFFNYIHVIYVVKEENQARTYEKL